MDLIDAGLIDIILGLGIAVVIIVATLAAVGLLGLDNLWRPK